MPFSNLSTTRKQFGRADIPGGACTVARMSQQSAQLLELVLISVVFVLIILRLARRRLISFRYAVGWLTLGVFVLIAGLLIPAASPLARFLQVGEFTIVAAAATAILLAVCVQLSISISGLQRQVQRLSEDIALLRMDAESRDEK